MFSFVLNAYAHHYFSSNEKHSAFRILLVAYLWSQHSSSIKFNPKYISLCVCALVGSRCMFAHCLAFRNVLERLKIHHTKWLLQFFNSMGDWFWLFIGFATFVCNSALMPSHVNNWMTERQRHILQTILSFHQELVIEVEFSSYYFLSSFWFFYLCQHWAMLYCSVLCCSVLFCSVLYCAVLCCAVPSYAMLCQAMLFRSMLKPNYAVLNCAILSQVRRITDIWNWTVIIEWKYGEQIENINLPVL